MSRVPFFVLELSLKGNLILLGDAKLTILFNKGSIFASKINRDIALYLLMLKRLLDMNKRMP